MMKEHDVVEVNGEWSAKVSDGHDTRQTGQPGAIEM